jgi:hypothetical protein
MKFTPKKLKDQVIVITGASSGIGLATARMAARRGARVVSAVTDVSDEAAVSRLGETALLEFGTIDTWVNNAGLSIYGKLTDVPLADKRKLFDVNFWGVVHGCRTAVRLMKHRGGVLINLGSDVSERPLRDVLVGGAGRMQVAMGTVAPRLTDAWMRRSMFRNQKTNDRSQPREGSLERPQRDGRAYGPHRGHVMRSSAYLRILPFVAAAAVVAAGVRRWRAAELLRVELPGLLGGHGSAEQRDRSRQYRIASGGEVCRGREQHLIGCHADFFEPESIRHDRVGHRNAGSVERRRSRTVHFLSKPV